MEFDTYPAYPRYRTLHLTEPLTRGADCYALQTALRACGFNPGPLDGVLGRGTSGAIREAQTGLVLVVDGLAGGWTQRALALSVAAGVQRARNLPDGLLRGQLEHESGMRLGNYSPIRPDGSYDAGVAQRNTKFTPPKDGFTVPASIDVLGRVVREHYDLFAGVHTPRRWALAQGAWNAPAVACFVAREEGATRVTAGMTVRPGPENRAVFEQYVASVGAFLTT